MVQSGNIGENANTARRSHVEDLLDEALKETFPASDPVSIIVEEVKLVASRHRDDSTSDKKQNRRSSEPDRRR